MDFSRSLGRVLEQLLALLQPADSLPHAAKNGHLFVVLRSVKHVEAGVQAQRPLQLGVALQACLVHTDLEQVGVVRGLQQLLD